MAEISIKRAYAPPAATTGRRVLVDHLAAPLVGEAEAKLDGWMKEVAPSPLRRWFGHQPERWEEFRRLYREKRQPGGRGAARARRRGPAHARLRRRPLKPTTEAPGCWPNG